LAAPVRADFSAAADLALLSRRDVSFWSPIQWSANGGIDDSGALGISATHDSIYSASSVAFEDVGSQIVLSAFFRTTDPGVVNQGNYFSYAEVYLTRSPTGYRFTDNTAFVHVDVLSDHERIWGGPLPTGGGSFAGFTEEFPRGTITPGHWYELRVKYERLSGDRIGWQIDFNDYGIDGLNYLKTDISSTQQTPDGLGITTDPTLYAGFRADAGVTLAIDNFSLLEVAEPNSTVLLLSILVLSGRRKRAESGEPELATIAAAPRRGTIRCVGRRFGRDR
jgi:hypothetical protein